ncbi:phosphatase PAP2 family protein [Alteribacter natronophilus]|uniref:phosphatase PAP2 family protein n=1 Tax=Alteribacter natronophilus TaxID=2583810 RepID=UPI00110EDCCB|nr:phosphatase PAP2 family protein [Alteribacter natronophilus]TMW70381.1 phosphatase PAP2 family protein [Alteribacter natronophilus]
MKAIRNKYVLTAVISFLLFLIVTLLRNDLQVLDEFLISRLTDIPPGLLSAMQIFTYAGSGEFILIITVLIGAGLALKKNYYNAVMLGVLVFGGIILNYALKVLFQRERPGEMSVIEVFGYSLELASYSFPSGHTMRTTILILFLIFLTHHLSKVPITRMSLYLLFTLILIAVAISRITTGAHYPTDIAGAVFISTTWFCVCLMGCRSLIVKGSIKA